MTGYHEFISLYGNVTLAELITFGFAVAFVVFLSKKLHSFLQKKFKEEHEKNAKLEKVFSAIEKLPDFETELKAIKDEQNRQGERLKQMEETSDRRARNRLRETLLQNYRYYTSKDRNPMHSWTKMESEAFWAIMSDYELSGGNDFMHSIVKPAMNELTVIEMTDAEGVSELMHSRK